MNDLISKWSDLWEPREKPTLSEWAENNLYLSSDYAAKTGPIQLFGWQRGLFDSFTDPEVETIVVMCGTQLVKTLFIQASLAYVIAEDPGPALLTQPKEDDAQAFSKERLAPMIRDCRALRGKVADVKGRSTSNTILDKRFDGGSIALVGAQTPGNLARRSIRYLFCDEIDKYPASAGTEGDPIGLARERTVTYRSRRKIILTCSPTVKGKSRIGKAYLESDQRKPWVACHACGERQILEWARVRWNSDLKAEQRAASAYYECAHCNARWNDVQRWDACDDAEWRAAKPFAGIAGFWISHLYSPWKKLSEIVADFLSSKDDRQRFKVFVNTALADLWEEAGETPIPDILFGRREAYPFGENAIVPRRALFLTAGVDVQDDRLEYEVTGWGRGKESWSVDYGVIRVFDGVDPVRTSDPRVWRELEKVLMRDWKHEAGATIAIMVMAIDTGDRPKPVYEFARNHTQAAYSPSWGLRVVAPRTVVPIKGTSRETLKLIASVSGEDAAKKRGNIRIVSIGTAVAKGELYDNLRLPRPKGDPSPGYCHFPQYGEEYFEGLCSERRVVHEDGNVSWEKNGRNEPLDCRVYSRAMAGLFGIDMFGEKQWRRLEELLHVQEDNNLDIPAPLAESAPNPTPPVAAYAAPSRSRRPRVILSNWANR